MTSIEMCVLFRELAQQMGMQNVRALTKEQIYELLNTSISDIVNQIVVQYLGKDRTNNVETDKLGLINALRTLYKDEDIKFPIMNQDATPFSGIADDELSFVWNKGHEDAIFVSNVTLPDCLVYTDLAINYIKCKSNNHGWEYDNDGSSDYIVNQVYVPVVKKVKSADTEPEFVTKDFRVRFSDNFYLPEAINDHILRAQYTSPIAVISNGQIEIHFGKLSNTGFIDKDLEPYTLKIRYIANPAKISDSVNCDIPKYLHIAVVKQAVELWKSSINIQVQSGQQNVQ